MHIQAALNFSEFFERLSGCLERLGRYCPRLEEYGKLFEESARVRKALSDFYSIVVEFCTKVVRRLQKKGMLRNKITSPGNVQYAALKPIVHTGLNRFLNSMKPYDADLKPLEGKLEFARQEVHEEIVLASEQSAGSGRELQLIHYNAQLNHHNVQLNHHNVQLIHHNENKQRISDCVAEVKKEGFLQRAEARLFRAQQTEALAEIRMLEIERIAREEGSEYLTTTSPADV